MTIEQALEAVVEIKDSVCRTTIKVCDEECEHLRFCEHCFALIDHLKKLKEKGQVNL